VSKKKLAVDLDFLGKIPWLILLSWAGAVYLIPSFVVGDLDLFSLMMQEENIPGRLLYVVWFTMMTAFSFMAYHESRRYH
jgi:hypothetical protein